MDVRAVQVGQVRRADVLKREGIQWRWGLGEGVDVAVAVVAGR